MEERFKFRRVNELTGVFVLAVLALGIAALIMAGRSQHWFAPTFAVQLALPDSGANGLSRGNEVQILGLNAGAVESVFVDPQGQLRARLRIRNDFKPFIRADSTAVIKKTLGVAGDSFVEISKGVAGPVPGRDAILSCRSSDELPGMVDKLLAEVRGEVVPVLRKASAGLDEWTRLGSEVGKTQSDLRQLIGRLDRLATGLEQGKGTAGRLLGDSLIANDAERLLADMRRLATNAGVSLGDLQAAMKNLNEGTARLPEITGTVAQEMKDLPGLVLQAQQAVFEASRLVEALQRHWLVRRYVDQGDPADSRISPTQVTPPKP